MTAENPARTTMVKSINISSLVLEWGAISAGRIDPISFKYTAANCEFTVLNNVAVGGSARFSLVSGLIMSAVTIAQGGVTIFSGIVDEIVDITDAQCTVRCIGKEIRLSKNLALEIMTRDAYPSALSTDIGKYIPYVFGACKRVPFLGAEVGLIAVLPSALAAGETISFPKSAFLGLDDLIAIYGIVGNFIAGDSIVHFTISGDNIYFENTSSYYIERGQILTGLFDEYVYIIGSRVQSIDAVYINGVYVPESAYDKFTGQYGNTHATYMDVAAISFHQNPAILATIPTSPSLKEGGTPCPSVAAQGLMTGSAILKAYPTSSTGTTNPANAYDQDENTYYDGETDALQSVTYTIPKPSGINLSSITAIKVKYLADTINSGVHADDTIYINITSNTSAWIGAVFFPAYPSSCTGKAWFEFSVLSYLNTDQTGDALIQIGASSYYPRIYEIYVEITYDQDYSIIPLLPANQTGNVYPAYQSEPATNDDAFDRDESTCFDSALVTPPESGGDKYAVFKFPALCSAQIPGEIKSATLKILCDTSFCAAPDSTVVISEVGDAGVTLSDTIDPSGGKAWFTVDITAWDAYLTSDIKVAWASGATSNIRIYEICFEITYDNGTTSQVPSSTAGTTVDMLNTTMAQVTADVTGEYSDLADILRDLIITRAGMTGMCSYGAGSTGVDMSLCLLEPTNILDLVQNLALQGGYAGYFRVGVHYLLALSGGYSDDATIASSDIDQAKATCNWTNRTYVVNKLIASYGRIWSGDGNQGENTVLSEDATSQSAYGIQQQLVALPYVPDSTLAQTVADALVYLLKIPRLLIAFTGGLTNNINRKLGEVIGVASGDSNLVKVLAGMASSSDHFLILEVSFNATGDITIECVQIYVSGSGAAP